MRACRLLPVAALLVGLALAGCGSSDQDSTTTVKPPPPVAAETPSAPVGAVAKRCDTYAEDLTTLQVTGVSCAEARKVAYAWQRSARCSEQSKGSRGACPVASYRCLAANAGQGTVVSCAKAERAISFIERSKG